MRLYYCQGKCYTREKNMIFETILFLALLGSGSVILINKLFYAKRKRLFSKKSTNMEFTKSIFSVLLIVFLLRSFAFEAFRIPSESMNPTLLAGDLILVDKYSHGLRLPIVGTRLSKAGTPKRGDIVVFRALVNGKTSGVIKRIVGLPGDHIRYHNKTLFINGEPAPQHLIKTATMLNEQGIEYPIIHSQETLSGIRHDIYTSPAIAINDYPFKNIKVPAQSYFVLGDSRDHSNDSRYWGVIEDHDIVGKARWIWMSLDWHKLAISNISKIKKFIRWNRVGSIA